MWLGVDLLRTGDEWISFPSLSGRCGAAKQDRRGVNAGGGGVGDLVTPHADDNGGSRQGCGFLLGLKIDNACVTRGGCT